ncbi:MAG: hypothetical protein GF416_07150 [Candidatus Altiarchaeales archaeon]|nr:hypothetical protein [Candidatus Altiarchaeales archaeon]MBD3416889.1 hypothetical protein [Candidatus Altiarchaeales archaeon]
MKYLSEIAGKKVCDVNGVDVGEAEDLEISLSEDDIFLRVKGEAMKELRGRKTEFIPIREIDYVKDRVYLYKRLKELKGIVEEVFMSNTPSYKCMDLIGRLVTSDNEKVGKVVDFGVDKQANEVMMLIEGLKVEDVRGKKKEKIPVFEISEITSNIRLQHDFETLSKRIVEKRRR